VRRFGREEIDAVLEVLRRDPVCLSGYYRNPRGGPSVQRFEEALARYHRVKHAVCVSNGTCALHVALLACGIGPGDEVITTPLTFSATATSILMCGATPVFVDVDPRTYNLDPSKVGGAITDRTAAIVPVHLLGTPADMDPIMEIAAKHDLWVIEDNAQCLGGRYKGRLTGTIGQLSILSFQETKPITALGEGGAILTNDDGLAEKCRYLRNHGSQYGEVPYLTFNYRMTEAAAAFGRVQLGRVDEFNRIQRRNAEILIKNLPDGIRPPHIPDYAEPTRYILGCIAEEGFLREKFVEDMTKIGVNKNLPGATISLGYQKTLMDLPLLRPFKRPCPVAEDLVRHFLFFDCMRWRSEDEAKKIAEKIRGEERFGWGER